MSVIEQATAVVAEAQATLTVAAEGAYTHVLGAAEVAQSHISGVATQAAAAAEEVVSVGVPLVVHYRDIVMETTSAVFGSAQFAEGALPLAMHYRDVVMEAPAVKAVLGSEAFNSTVQVGFKLRDHGIEGVETLRVGFNEMASDLEAWQIVACTVLAIIVLNYVSRVLVWMNGITKEGIWKFVFNLPIVRVFVSRKIDKIKAELRVSLVHPCGDLDRFEALPQQGLPYDEIMKQVKKHNAIETIDWRGGRISGTVYDGSSQLTQLLTDVWGKTAWANPLHPDVFLGVRKMDAEIVSMVRDMFHGSRKEACGTTTSGGTESIIMACRAHIVKYRSRTSKPEIIVCDSVHAAFDKACEYFGVKLVKLPAESTTRMADVGAFKRHINKNTVLIVGSAPSYPHGVMDPITELGKLAVRYDVGLHVDACLGGFLIPFMDEAGFKLPPFDFRVKGVTSMSVDTHKYGFAPKGNSVVLYANHALRQCQYFTQPNWTGGVYASPTIAGSRSGAIVAASWAALVYHGRKGYVEATRDIISAARTVREGLEQIEGIKVCGDPLVSVVAIKSDVFDIYRLASYLNERKWSLSALQFPASLHIACTRVHTPAVVQDFLADVAAGVKEIMKNPGRANSGSAAVYGTAAAVPDRSMIAKVAASFCDTLYAIQDEVPLKKTE